MTGPFLCGKKSGVRHPRKVAFLLPGQGQRKNAEKSAKKNAACGRRLIKNGVQTKDRPDTGFFGKSGTRTLDPHDVNVVL